MGIKSILLFVSMAAISYNQIMVAAEVTVTTTNSGLEKIKVLDDLNEKNCGESTTPATKTDCCKKFIADYTSTNGDNEKIKVLCTAFKKTDNTDYNGCTEKNKKAINTNACNTEKPKTQLNQELSNKGAVLRLEFDEWKNIGTACKTEHHTELKELTTENQIFSHCKNIDKKAFNNKCDSGEKTKLAEAVCKLTKKAEADKKKPIDNIMKTASTTNCKFLVTGAMTTWYDIENICKTVTFTQKDEFVEKCTKTGEYDKVKDAACSVGVGARPCKNEATGGSSAVFSGLLTISVSLIAALFTKS